MKFNKYFLLTVLALFLVHEVAQAQYGRRGRGSRKSMKLGVGAEVGYFTYNGDLGAEVGSRAIPTMTLGYSFLLDQRFGEVTRSSSMFGFQVRYITGKLEEYDRKMLRRLNFQSNISQVEFIAKFHFEQLLNWHKRSPFSPYIGIGAGYLMFDTYIDSLGVDGLPYDMTKFTDGVSVKEFNKEYRDQDYETHKVKAIAICLPAIIGIDYNFTPKMRLRASMTYYYSFNDDIDAKNNPGPENRFNDFYVYHSASLIYNFGKAGSAYKRKRYKSKF